ncbi:MAG TPA: hypothetical protein GXZ69_01895 [Spirochaetales bacterium]|jgi:hypothetical protein|nr:hypothetical protein [Spirochaetales bacterium]
MEKKVQCILNWTVLVMLVIPLSGCSMGWEAQTKAKITDKELFPTVARIIDEQKGVVWEYLEEDLSRALSSDEYTGFDIVQSTLSEEQGRQYMEFCYAVNDLDAADQAQNVVEFARSLISEEEMASLEQKLAENRSLMLSEAEHFSRALSPSQRAPFWKDMQKLLTRTTVLFTAGVVYACIPSVVFWGKISAATAIAVATGVVASTIMSIWRYYQFGGDLDESFNDWLISVTTEPEVSYALAASMISVGTTLKRGFVVTGIIICVFALYNVIDMVKPMLKKYNFKV